MKSIIFVLFVLRYFGNLINGFELKENNFELKERKIYTSTYVAKDGICSDEYMQFQRQLLMTKYNTDDAYFSCQQIEDYRGILYTKYRKIVLV